jgi:3-isopropylmalate/(R)-2-methylmalate dehydratase small subunit
MKAVRVHTGRAVPLPRSDVDTDQIIPSDWLKRVERTGFGRGLFSEWRDEPSFVLNDERYAGASILVAGPNFGVGSSREHAVWALMDYGFDVVIAPRFGDIFRNNSTKNGLVPVVLSDEIVERLHVALDDDPGMEIVVDVERLVVEVPSLGIVETFVLDESTQHRFLHGLDDIGISLAHADEITAFEERRPSYLPSVT